VAYWRTGGNSKGLGAVRVPTPTGWTAVVAQPGQRFRSVGYGDSAKLRTAIIMADVAKAEQFHPLVLRCAESLAMSVPERDGDAICCAIRRFLAANFFFLEDTRDADKVRLPSEQLALYYGGEGMRGDCDCCATLGLALALAVGRDGRLCLVGFARDEEFTHIFAEIAGDSGWVDLDTTKPHGPVAPFERGVVMEV
jgi:hypothetical protein